MVCPLSGTGACHLGSLTKCHVLGLCWCSPSPEEDRTRPFCLLFHRRWQDGQRPVIARIFLLEMAVLLWPMLQILLNFILFYFLIKTKVVSIQYIMQFPSISSQIPHLSTFPTPCLLSLSPKKIKTSKKEKQKG